MHVPAKPVPDCSTDATRNEEARPRRRLPCEVVRAWVRESARGDSGMRPDGDQHRPACLTRWQGQVRVCLEHRDAWLHACRRLSNPFGRPRRTGAGSRQTNVHSSTRAGYGIRQTESLQPKRTAPSRMPHLIWHGLVGATRRFPGCIVSFAQAQWLRLAGRRIALRDERRLAVLLRRSPFAIQQKKQARHRQQNQRHSKQQAGNDRDREGSLHRGAGA